MEDVKGKRIFVGLSGGVDSAVSAVVLQKAGAEVTGVFIKGWYPPGMPCTWADDRRDAMRVAASLGIPFHTLDASAEYKKGVIDYLLAEYAAGRTPNPDVMCNREVKFGAFYEFAKARGADFIATGHYARSVIQPSSCRHAPIISQPTHARTRLLRGTDPSKDQSYFLWAIPREALSHTLFPVGELPKSEVRVLAKRFKLPVAEKKDSQGICFLGSISVDDFLRQEMHTETGKVFTTDGEQVGEHDGAVLYTLGARIALRPLHSRVEAGPWYVVAKDMEANTLTVSKEQFRQSSREAITLRDTNWFEELTDEESNKEKLVEAQYRYHGPIVKGAFDFKKNIFTPHDLLNEPVASGQSLVLLCR